MWSLCKSVKRSEAMLTEIHGLNVWVVFISSSFASCPNCQLDMLVLHKILITHGQMGCEEKEWGNNQIHGKKQKKGKQGQMNTASWGYQSYTHRLSVLLCCFCMCAYLNFYNHYLATRDSWLQSTHDRTRVCAHWGLSLYLAQSHGHNMKLHAHTYTYFLSCTSIFWGPICILDLKV